MAAERNAREARGSAGLRMGARARVAGEPETSGDAWGLDLADFGGNGQILLRSIQ